MSTHGPSPTFFRFSRRVVVDFASLRSFRRTCSSEPPFDRHDWVVHRTSPTDPHGPATETRYVIDYYSAPPDEEGNPVFYLDTRPALDSVGAVVGRIGEMARGAFGRGGGLDQQQEE